MSDDELTLEELEEMDEISRTSEISQNRVLQEDSPFLDTVADVTSGAARGVLKAADETLDFLGSTADSGFEMVQKYIFGDEDADGFMDDLGAGENIFGVSDWIDAPSSTAGQISQDLTQFIGGYILPGGVALKTAKAGTRAARYFGAKKPLKGSDFETVQKLGKITGKGINKAAKAVEKGLDSRVGSSMFKSAVSASVAHDPYAKRLSDIIQENPALANPVNEWLASDPTDGQALNRFKAALEDIALGGIFEGVLKLATKVKGRGAGKDTEPDAVTDEAIKKDQEKTVKAREKKAAEKQKKFKAAEKEQKLKEEGKKTDLKNTKELFTENVEKNAAKDGMATRDYLNSKNKDWLAKSADELGIKYNTKTTRKEILDKLNKVIKDTEKLRNTTKVKVKDTKTSGIKKVATPKAINTQLVENLKKSIKDPKSLKLALNSQKNIMNFTNHTKKDDKYFSRFANDASDEMVNVINESIKTLAPTLKGIKNKQSIEEAFQESAKFLQDMTGTKAKDWEKIAYTYGKGIEQAQSALIGIQSKIANQLNTLKNISKADSAAKNANEKLLLERKFIEETEALQKYLAASKMIQAPIGRALRMQREKIMDTDSIITGFKAAEDALGGKAALKKFKFALANSSSNMRDFGKHMKLLEPSGLHKSQAVLSELFRSMILFNFKTHITNTLSGLVETGFVPLEKKVGAIAARVFGQISAAEYKQLSNQIKAHYMGVSLAKKQAYYYAKQAFKNERNILDPLNRQLEHQDINKLTSEYLNISKGKLGSFVDSIGKTTRGSLRLLGSEDEFIKQINYRAKIFSDGYLEGLEMGQKGEALKKYALKKVDDAFDANGMATNKEALQYARQITFTEDLEISLFKNIQRLANQTPALQLFLPFVRTPSNLIIRAAQRSGPLGLLSKRMRNDILNGTPEQKALAIGRLTTSSAIGFGIFSLISEGRITAGGPPDPQQNRLWRMAGNQPYSIRVGGNWIGYNRLDPLFMPVGALANLAEAQDFDASQDAAAAVIYGLSSVLQDKAYFQGITNLLSAISESNPDRISDMTSFGENLVASFIPAAPQQLTEMFFSSSYNEYGFDETEYAPLREAIGLTDKIRRRLPRINENLPVKYNWLTGKPLLNYDPMSTGFPIKPDDFSDEVSTELLDLNYGFQGVPKTINKVELNSQEFSDFNRFMGTIKIDGRTLLQSVKRAMDNSQYRRDDPDRIYDGMFASPEIKVISEIFSKYRGAAKVELMKKHPELRQKIFLSKRSKATGRNYLEEFLESNR